MKRLKRILSILLAIGIIFSSSQVFASSELEKYIGEPNITEEFKNWLELSEEERSKVLMPRSYEILDHKYTYNNPIRLAQTVGSATIAKYDLRDYIPENVKIKNQMNTNSCWAFASLGALESNLALSDYSNNKEAKIYDFSERHMEYATTRKFKNNEVNLFGFNRIAGDGANYFVSRPYMVNGFGPINEKEMPFENNEEQIELKDIQEKTVVAQVYDTIEFPQHTSDDDKTEIIKQMKEHIRKNGGIEAGVFGADIVSDYYNKETGAIYCDDASKCPYNHDVVIIGWDDNYPVENFNELHRPKNPGAWIVKNSWGEEISYTITEMKEAIFEVYENECKQNGWNTASEIPDEFANELFEVMGYTIENNKAVLKVGDKGYMYISYEDANVYLLLTGFEKATTKINYDNIYQYDYFGAVMALPLTVQTAYASSTFERTTNEKEYLTEISLYVIETTTCEVYVNPNGNSKDKKDLIKITLKEGKSETFNPGYHTIEFAEPIELTEKEFTVVVRLEGKNNSGYYIPMESNVPQTAWSFVELEENKCHWTAGDDFFERNEWASFTQLSEMSNGKIPDGDMTIKAFTVKQIEKDKLEKIEIATPPSKIEYEEGQDFDKTGMVVNAIYVDGTKEEIKDYTVKNGTKLTKGQTEVIIEYKGKEASQKITVKEKVSEQTPVEELELSNFDKAKANVNNVKVYYFTDKNKKEYTTIDLNLNDIERTSIKDNYKYYYYLSSSQSEKNIKNWVAISEEQNSKTKLSFRINTKDISNYDEVSKADNLYLYIKEEIKTEDYQKEGITKAILLDTKGKITVYKDNVIQKEDESNDNSNTNTNANTNTNTNINTNTNTNKVNNTNNGKDNTVSPQILPATGLRFGLMLVIIAITMYGIIKFVQYNKMDF